MQPHEVASDVINGLSLSVSHRPRNRQDFLNMVRPLEHSMRTNFLQQSLRFLLALNGTMRHASRHLNVLANDFRYSSLTRKAFKDMVSLKLL